MHDDKDDEESANDSINHKCQTILNLCKSGSAKDAISLHAGLNQGFLTFAHCYF
jgi:hypothetical protein